MDYQFVDSGNQKKLERFGPYLIERPCAQALWRPQSPWNPDASFCRKREEKWQGKLPNTWEAKYDGLYFKLSPTQFGHVGLFPEHQSLWDLGTKHSVVGKEILNLFAYSGGATMAFAKKGAKVCHVDASDPMVLWAKENAKRNNLHEHPIRWIVDDAIKFLQREKRRGRTYDGILLDPPTFGRGSKKEVFKIERDLPKLLELCVSLLSKDPLFVICSSHTEILTPTVMKHLMDQASKPLGEGVGCGELLLEGKEVPSLPTGSYSYWVAT